MTTPTVDRSGRFRPRRRLLVALLALAVIGGVAFVEVPRILSPAPTTTVWQAITAGIKNGTVPKQTALEAFAYVFKVGIPGVSVPGGAEGGDGPTSGTGVMSWVHANWKALSADQQAVINRYMAPADGAGTIRMTPAPTAAAGVARPQFQLMGAVNPWPIDTELAPDAPTDLAMAMAAEIVTDVDHIGPKLGLPVIQPGLPFLPWIDLTITDASGGDAFFLTQIVENTNVGYFEPCHITAYSEAWKGESVTGGGAVSPRLHVLMTHEVVHCYQNTIWKSRAIGDQIPSWMKEGTAMYLAADDTSIAEPILAEVWTKGYIGRAETALTDRTYDSFGYFALLAHQGRDLWDLMAKAWQAAAKGPERSSAFIDVLHGNDPDIINNWAESYLRQEPWGDPWIMYGFGLPDSAQVTQHPVQAQSSPGWTGSVNSLANTVLNVTSSSGEVVTVTTDGLASVHDSQGGTAVAFTTRSFCTKEGGCVCPAGTLLQGKDVASEQLLIPFVAAFNGAVGGSRYAIIADTLDHLCQRPATPAPQGSPSNGPCGPSCSQSNGDPHLLTVNKYRYDFQAAGEFTLLRSADGSVDVQSRQEPYGQGFVSTNTAIAAKVGSHRVGVYVTDTGLLARVDGRVADLSAGPKSLGGVGRISAIDNGFEIDFPDGTQLWTLSVGIYGINAQVKPSAGLAKSGAGLLGPVVPGGLGVPALPDGTRLPAGANGTARNDTLYGQFADAWRLTDSTTLFDYDKGKSTASYTVKPYPKTPKYATLTDLSAAQAAAGTSACSAITDPDLHDECVFDVGVTGQTGFAGNYTVVNDFYDTGVLLPTPAPPATTSFPPATPPPGLAGAVTVTQGVALAGYALGPDDTVYMSVQTADTKFTLIAFDPKAGKIVKQVDVPAKTPVHFAAGSLWLPGLKTDANGHNCSVTRVDPASLAEVATVAVPCSPFDDAPPVTSDGDAVWFTDVSKVDVTTNLGGVLTRIDPATNAPGTSVALPFLGGSTVDSQGALFIYGADKGTYRLTTGATAFESLGSNLRGPLWAAGTGVWAADTGGKSASYYTSAGTPAATVSTGAGMVAGDTKAVYAEVLGSNAQDVTEEQLWRYPIDGSTPTQIASSPTLNGDFLPYGNDPLPISNGDGVLKLWATSSGGQQLKSILLQWTPVP